jgi:hypothetical protein
MLMIYNADPPYRELGLEVMRRGGTSSQFALEKLGYALHGISGREARVRAGILAQHYAMDATHCRAQSDREILWT